MKNSKTRRLSTEEMVCLTSKRLCCDEGITSQISIITDL